MLCTALTWGGVAAAQEREPNPLLTIDLDIGLRIDDETRLRTGVGLTYLTRTRTQTLELSLGTAVDITDDGIDTDTTFPTVTLDYTRDTGVMLFSLESSYRVVDVEGTVPGPDAAFDASDLIDDDGQLATTTLNLALELWRRDPVGLEFGASFRDRSYQNTADPDLDDSRNWSVNAALRLEPRPGLAFRLLADQSQSEDDGTLESETTTTNFGASVAWEATPGTTLEASLRHSTREEERNQTAIALVGGVPAQVLTGGRETVTSDGLVWDATLTHARPNGTIGLAFSRNLTAGGGLSELTATRSLELPRDTTLSGALGVAHFEGGKTVLVGNLRYARPLTPNGDLSFALTRAASVDGDEQDVVQTRATLEHRQVLTPNASVSLSLGIAEIKVVDGFEPDEVSTTYGVTFNQALTPDWGLGIGYRGSTSRTDGFARTSNDQFFVNLNRSFTFRP